MRKQIEPTRKERLADKLDRLRDPLVPSRGPVKRRELRTSDEPARWDCETNRQGSEGS